MEQQKKMKHEYRLENITWWYSVSLAYPRLHHHKLPSTQVNDDYSVCGNWQNGQSLDQYKDSVWGIP